MTRNPTRSTVSGRAYLDLQNLARKQNRPTDELHQIYALEGFLSRLAISRHAEAFVLKGGVLLAAYGNRRPTRDVDLQGHELPNDEAHVLSVVRTIAETPLDDGLEFDSANAIAESIRDEDAYAGVRVTLGGTLSAAKLRFHVDVNVGDPVVPPPQRIELPRLLSGTIALAGYPLPMVHAEKIVTAMQRGIANTRWRDFADVYTLNRHHDIDGDQLGAAIDQVAHHRQASKTQLIQVLDGYGPIAQSRWAAWRRKQRLDDRLPQNIEEVLRDVISFADPAIAGSVKGRVWSAAARSWNHDQPDNQ